MFYFLEEAREIKFQIAKHFNILDILKSLGIIGYNIYPEERMGQIHIKIPDKTLKAVSKKAKQYNYSTQEFVVRTLERTLETFIVEEQMSLFLSGKYDNSNGKSGLFTFIDLFSGIGGIRLAFQENGGKCVFSSEWDRWCQKTYFENFGEMPEGDITKINPKDIPDHDILTAGFPCQPFSIAGVSKKKSLGHEHGFMDKAQGTLFFNVAEIIKAKRPKMFLLENVKNLESHDSGNTFRVIKGTLEELDYSLCHRVLDARYYVPQHRERLFIVGFDKRRFKTPPEFEFPIPPKSEPKLVSILQKKVDPRYILSNHLWNYLQNYAEKHRLKGNGFGFGLVDGKSTTRTLSARYYKDGSEILVKVPGSNPRRLTPRECARLQGFPETFNIPVSDTQAYKQFGNSVVVPVVSSVAAKMAAIHKSLPVPF